MKNKKILKQLQLTLSQEFHQKTKINKNGKELDLKKWPQSWTKVNFKGYPRFDAIKLSKPIIPDMLFSQVLEHRRSVRKFTHNPLTEKQVSSLLYFSAGLREKNTFMQANRFYPSAGARYPLEVYPIILNSDKLDRGVYHYYLKSHLLEVLPKVKNLQNKTLNYFGNQKWMNNSSVVVIVSAIFLRNQVKYGERGYRHVMAEVGALIQNFYLVSTALGIGCCPTGGFLDDKFNKMLDIDGIEESTVAVIAFGNKK